MSFTIIKFHEIPLRGFRGVAMKKYQDCRTDGRVKIITSSNVILLLFHNVFISIYIYDNIWATYPTRGVDMMYTVVIREFG